MRHVLKVSWLKASEASLGAQRRCLLTGTMRMTVAFGVFLATGLQFIETAHATASVGKTPISVTASLIPSRELMQGQPVELDWLMSNPNPSEDVSVEIKEDLQWCRFELRRGDAVISEWRPKVHAIPGTSFHKFPVYSLATPMRLRTIAAPALTQVPTGAYTLRVHVVLKHGLSEYSRSGFLDARATIMERDFDLPVTVIPVDEDAMRERTHRLYTRIVLEKDPTNRESLMEALAKMPPEYAQRAWRSLLFSKDMPGQDRFRLAFVLSSVVSKPIVDTLIEVQNTDPIRDEQGQILTLTPLVIGMGSNATPEMLKYIDLQVAKTRNSIFRVPYALD